MMQTESMKSPPTLPQFLKLAVAAVAASVLASCSSAATDTISLQQPLLGNQTIVSGRGKFELGYFSPGNSGKFYVGIWYKNLPVQTVIWVGNRRSPLDDTSSAELRISPEDGNLNLVVLGSRSVAPPVVWSSNLSSPSSSSNTAVLLDNGNLVLLDGGQDNSSSSDRVLWQSFDHPSDTLVPGAWLGENKITGAYQALTSWKNSEDPAPGIFLDTVDPGGSSEFFYMWNQSKLYWRSGVWTGQVFALLPEMRMNTLFNMTYVETKQYRRVTSTLYDNSTITRLVLDLTGQTKQYIWVNSSQRWQLFWTAPTVQCDVYSLCGAFGICDQRSLPFCRCPPGFEPASQREWNLSDWSSGCRRKVQLQCERNESDGFMEMSNMKLPDNSETLNVRSRTECESACLGNCSCQAYAYSDGSGCRVWNGDLRNAQQLYADADNSNTTLYLRLAASELKILSNRRKKVSVSVVLSVCLVFLGVLGTAVLAWMFYRRKSASREKKRGSMVLFSYSDLRNATRNFSERLGGGGFGSVYKGVLNGSVEVAVKKLEGLRQGDKQFRTEVNTLGLIQHVNLVRLIGFCAAGDNKLLVYEFMSNGSLDSYLVKNSSNLNWRDRYRIMLGIARGLAYLHEGCRECIIHCDIKPENILLDADLCPKIADFGMAKLVGRDFSRALTTMRGTIGYLAPEWISGLPISAKADVYSFGMILFELISGRRNTEHSNGTENIFFPVWAANRVAEGDVLSLADARLGGDVSMEELGRACRVACWCIQDQEVHRPSMAQVVQVLEGVADVYLPPVPQALQHLVALN